MGELDLIRHFRAHAPKHPWLLVGPGQDCAVLKWPSARDLVFKIDQVVEGTHFTSVTRPRDVGWKAMAKACSDLAAAGAWPVAATVAVNLRRGSDERVAKELYAGLCKCCKQFGFALAGGDIAVSDNGLSVTVSLVGEVANGKAWTRAGAQPGDVLLVTGTLGGSLAGKHLHFTPRLEDARQIRALAGGGVHACIDITDGLSRDLYHLCEESRCGAIIMGSLFPVSAAARKIERKTGPSSLTQVLGDGEDFELLLAVAPKAAKRLLKSWRGRVSLKEIGRVLPQSKGVQMMAHGGKLGKLENAGYEHGAKEKTVASSRAIITSSPAETEAIAERLARELPGGTLILLSGELGAGKTVFVRGLLRGLDAPPGQVVASPTYVLLHKYSGARRTLYHIDAYRLRGGAEEFEDSGLRECLDDPNALVAIEWPERVAGMQWPAPRVEIALEHAGAEKRKITVSRKDAKTQRKKRIGLKGRDKSAQGKRALKSHAPPWVDAAAKRVP